MTAAGDNVPPELIDETFAFELFQSECLWDLDCSKLPVDLDADDFDEHGSLLSPLPFCETEGGDSPSPYTSEKTASCGSNFVRRQSARIQDLVRQRLVEEIQKKNEMLDRGSEITDEESPPKTRSKQGHRKKSYSTGKTPKAKGGRRSTKKHITDPGGLVKGASNHDPLSDLQHHEADCGYTDEDPTKLWCVCRQPHSGRFMICCDRCDEWYHGDCVGVDPQRGAQMEEFVCPGCRRLDFSPSSTTTSSAEGQALPRTGYCENATSPTTNSQKGSVPTTTTTLTIHPSQTQNNISNIFEKVSLLRPTEPFRKEQRGPLVPSPQPAVSERSASSVRSPMVDAGAVVVSAAVKEPTEAISSLPEGQVDTGQCPSPVDKTKERAEANLEAPRLISPTSLLSPSTVKTAVVSSEATAGPKEDTPLVERRSWDTPILSLLAASAYPLEGAVDKEDLPADVQSTLKGPPSDHAEETKMTTEPRQAFSLESRRDTALPACTIRCLGPLCHNQVCPRVGLYCRADCLKQSVTEFLREQQNQTAPEKGPQRVVIVDRKSQTLVPRKKMPCLDESALIGYLEEHPTCQLISLRRKGSTGKRQENTATSDSKTTARQDSSSSLSGSSKDTDSGTKTSKRSVSEERELLRRRLSSVLEERIRQVRHLYTLSRRRLCQLVLDTESAIARRHCLYRLTQAEENKQSVNNHCQLADFRRHSQLLLRAIEADSKLAHLLLVGLISPAQLAVCTSEVRLKVLTQSFADGTVTGVDVVEPSHIAASGQGLNEYRGPETLSALGTQNSTVSSAHVRNTDTTAEHERHLYDVNCQKCNSVYKDKKPPDLTVTVSSKQPVANSVPLEEMLPVRVTDSTLLEATSKPSPSVSAPISVYTPTLASLPLAELSPEVKGSPKSFAHVGPPLSQHLKRHRPDNISASDGFSLPCPAVKRKSLDHLHAETFVNSTTTRQPHLSTGLLSLPFPPTSPSPASAKAVCWSGDILLSSRRSGRPDGTLSCSARLAARMPTAAGANADPPLPPALRVLGGIDARNMPRHLQKALQSGTMEVLMLRLEPTPASSANFAQAARVQRKLQAGCLAAVLGPRMPRTAGCFLWAPCESVELPLPGSDELSCDDGLFVLIIREMPPPSTPSPSPPALPFATEVLKPAGRTSPVSATVSSQAKTVKSLFSAPTSAPTPKEPIQTTTTVFAAQPQDEDLRVLCAGVALDARPPHPPPPPPAADSSALPYSADVDYRFLPQRGQQPALHDEDLRSLISTRSSDLS